MKRVTLESCTKEELIVLVQYLCHSYPDRDFYIVRGLNHIQERRRQALLDKISKHEEVVRIAWQEYIDKLKIHGGHPGGLMSLAMAQERAKKADKEHEKLLKQLEEDEI